jgi:hypothetical protein
LSSDEFGNFMRVTGHLRVGLTILLTLVLLVSAAYPCTWAQGYFHQVTRLRGTVVGVKNGDLRHPFRLLRQHVDVAQASLTLYDYPVRWTDGVKNRIVKQVIADDRGDFDFGTLPAGHYTLLIASSRGEDVFDIQVTTLKQPTASVTVDVSPNYPDCTGGHEFISVTE